jgi:WD40 repeat protein
MTTQTSAKPERRSCLKIGIIICLVPFLTCVVLFLVILFPFEDILLQLRPYPPPQVAISAQNVDQVRQIRQLPLTGFEVEFEAQLAWSPDSRLLGVVGNGGMVKLWEAATGKELTAITFQSGVSSLAFSPDSSMLVVGTNAALLYDVVTGRQVSAFLVPDSLPDGRPMTVAFSPDGKMLAGGMMGGTAILWDVASGKVLRTFSDPSAGSHSQVTFSPDGNILALAHSRVSLWNVTTGEMIRTLPAEGKVVMFLADGKTLLTSNGLWDITTGTRTMTFGVHGPRFCEAYLSDGVIGAYVPMPLPGFSFGGSFGVKIETGGVRDLGSDTSCPLAFSPDGRWLVTDASGGMKLWGVPP